MNSMVRNKYIANIPNFITVLRIIGAIVLAFQKTFSTEFFVIYIAAGVTDVIDGWMARRFKVTSMLGTRLDSIADLLFYSVMVAKIFDELMRLFPVSLWIFIWTTAAIRIFTYIFVAIKHRRFAAMHTYMNKLTGGTMFLLPCMLLTSYMVMYSWFSCTIAFLASIEEMVIHIVRKTYNANIKSILFMRT